MSQSALYVLLIGWSLCVTLGYKLGFRQGRLRGRKDVIVYLKNETERAKGGTVNVCDNPVEYDKCSA